MVVQNEFIITMHSHRKWLSSNFYMPTQYANPLIFMMPNPLLHILCVISLYLTILIHSLAWWWKTLCMSEYFLAILSCNLFMIRHSSCHTFISLQKKSYNSLNDSKFLLLILPLYTMVHESRGVSNGGDGCDHNRHPHAVDFDEKVQCIHSKYSWRHTTQCILHGSRWIKENRWRALGLKSLLARQLWKKQQAKEASIRKVFNSNELIVSTNIYGTLSTPSTSPSLLPHSPIPALAPRMA